MFTFHPAFEAPTGSPIRELFKYLAQPGMISFAGGYPASDLFDREGLDVAAARASQQPTLCLQYGPTDGLAVLKDQLAHLMTRRGTPCTPQELLVTTGSQQGFDLLLRVMVAPGDVVLVEQPAYPATLQALKLQAADVVTVPVDQDGLDVAALAALLDAGTFARPPKLLYTVPTFANPTGATLSLERRTALLKLAARHQFLIVEDDPYGDLRFNGAALPSLLALSNQVPGSRDWVVHFSSLSKIVAPGLRVGWMVAHAEILRRCLVAKQTVDLCSSPWTQAIAAEYLASGALERHLPRIVGAYAVKCRTLCDALDEHLGDAIAFHRPAGGMFVWAQLTGGQNASDMLRACIERNVMFVPGVAFYKDNVDLAALRLSFAAPGVAEIETGVQRMKQALSLF
ncbi:PLP-dependent aminotransferase family protein [Paraburkholderia domus]|jgi:Transcriptional regulators containing a DNA-binding HTH domain and an aminotransferase domain (MocR family) and their eukaryotic orthologs|uniref:2-aminoadipate transaminase n=1 Tax=Paraburkholderia domus TaxID=2793075 RepID=A0A9N8MTF1_9BURK|nr:PLP-dependent aminotransferase family protein [Paraburkholderia domus]MBK5054491.1 PLP-dependent aminotransferase family protein [Burkholderia sp. R-70006]MBK5125746.1 PLP-dependent aminotransferase family protein [Burkholderia sp. R-69980]MBK5169969.1 PLP-dependent aminotransferase family protein [Burkholderia sp. R-70211]MBK5186137.1 PLP-dependent aminotransferase family protein [Burkholderia sp. R-69749]CAE6771162.1 2-aminoadipate transaminase [Paraburkholderia domus]